MGVDSLIEGGPIALDTSIFIYFVERHAMYAELVRPLFAAADRGELELVTSSVTLLEVLVVPYRAGNLAVAERYEALLSRSRGLSMVEMDREQLRAAARIRARFGVKTPDALQLAAAITRRCTTFITNDRRLPELPGLRVVQLDSMR